MSLPPHDPSPTVPGPTPAGGHRGGLAGLPFALARVDRSGTVVALSGAWTDVSGRQVGASLGMPWDGFLDPGDVDAWRGMARDLYEGRRTQAAGVLRLRRPDGVARPVEVRSALHHGPTGPPDGLGVMLFDVAEREQALSAPRPSMRLSEESTRSLVERAAFGIFRCDPDGGLLDVNPALAAMLGYADPASLIGLNLFEVVGAEPGVRERCLAELEDGLADVSCDLRGARRDGAAVHLRLAVSAEFDGRRIRFLQGIAENITERARREEIVRRGERMAALARTLAGVAHEINNPLAAITGFAQILLKREQSDDDRHAHETILHQARRAAHVVKDLLTIARREEGSLRVRVDLNAIVRYLVETQRYAMDTRGIRIVMHLADDAPRVLGDPAQLEQVVLNLVVNARQALEARLDRHDADEAWLPTLEIATQRASARVTLSVTDNGPGISSRDLPHIWDPFWTTREEGEGSGLGLSVVHSIVTAHGGSIEATSVLGVETRVVVTLPAAAPAAPAPLAIPHHSTPAARAARPLDILVVDDEVAIRDLLVRYLSTRGHAVLPAASGEHALRLAEQASFDVVISDLRMPGMDGRALIRRLRSLPSCVDTRFILSTGDATALPHAGGDTTADLEVVNKPYDVNALVTLVEAR